MPTRSIVIFGPKGCGKASQAARLQQHHSRAQTSALYE